MTLTPTIALPPAATGPASVVQSIADDRFVSAQQTNATAQTQIASAQQAMVTSMAKLANFDSVPYPDYQVWLSFAVARAQQTNATASSTPEVAAYADRALAAFRQRFPSTTVGGGAPLIPVTAPVTLTTP